jgi:hypothetical protein
LGISTLANKSFMTILTFFGLGFEFERRSRGLNPLLF